MFRIVVMLMFDVLTCSTKVSRAKLNAVEVDDSAPFLRSVSYEAVSSSPPDYYFAGPDVLF